MPEITDEELAKRLESYYRQGDMDRDSEIFNHCVERFNPKDDDGLSTLGMIDLAADALEAAPCTCAPDAEEEADPCRRCEALGRLADKVIER